MTEATRRKRQHGTMSVRNITYHVLLEESWLS